MNRVSWSTADVPEADAVDYWSDLVCDTIMNVAVRATDGESFVGRFEYAAIDGIGLSTVESETSHRVTRTRRRIARDRQELFVVCIQTAGSCLVRQDGRAVTLVPGSMTFLDSTLPSSMELFGTSSLINIQLPRTWLPGRSLGGVTATQAHESEPGRLVADFLVGFVRLQRDSPVVAATLLPHAVGLVESVLDVAARGQTTPDSPTALTREQIHRFVRQHFHERSLDVGSVAAACGLSRSSVYRALADDDEPLTGLIRRLRVERAQRLLRARPELRLADVAALSGFGGKEQLHRAFHLVVGMTPGAYRMAAAGSEGMSGSR